MRWLGLSLISVLILILFMNFLLYSHFQDEIEREAVRLLKENGCNNVVAQTLRLPSSFVFLAQKSEAQLFTNIGQEDIMVNILVTPIGTLPLLWSLIDTTYYIEIPNLEMLKLQVSSNHCKGLLNDLLNF